MHTTIKTYTTTKKYYNHEHCWRETRDWVSPLNKCIIFTKHNRRLHTATEPKKATEREKCNKLLYYKLKNIIQHPVYYICLLLHWHVKDLFFLYFIFFWFLSLFCKDDKKNRTKTDNSVPFCSSSSSPYRSVFRSHIFFRFSCIDVAGWFLGLCWSEERRVKKKSFSLLLWLLLFFVTSKTSWVPHFKCLSIVWNYI